MHRRLGNGGWLAALLLLFIGSSARAESILYGGNGNSSANNAGAVIEYDATAGTWQPVFTPFSPAGSGGLSGLACNTAGDLFASSGGRTTAGLLFTIDLANHTSTQVATTIGGNPLGIGDLAYRADTNTLYGIGANSISSSQQGILYTIDPTSGHATQVLNTGTNRNGAIAFSPDGSILYLITPPSGSGTNSTLRRYDTATWTEVGTAVTIRNLKIDGLGIRPEDGQLFASDDLTGGVYRINPADGTYHLFSTPGTAGSPSDLAFRPVPEPSALVLGGIGALAVFGGRLRRRRDR